MPPGSMDGPPFFCYKKESFFTHNTLSAMIHANDSLITSSEKPDFSCISCQEIMELIPHRYPMLLVDRLEDVYLGTQATGIKNVTMNEWFFAGHFPENPVMPGVLIVEAMAQTAGVLVMKTLKTSHNASAVYLMSVDKARFRKPVLPGNTLRLIVTKHQARGNVWKFHGQAFIEKTLVSDAFFAATLVKQVS